MAHRPQKNQEEKKRHYSLEEVRIILETMSDANTVPLKQVLEREHGTRSFGRALRQIGRSNPSRLRYLIADLEGVQTRAQLLPVLYRIVFASELEKAKENKIIVPSEKDMSGLLEDVDRFDVPIVVGLLLVLSALRYPRSDEHLKYQLSTFIRALLALATVINIEGIEDDPSPLSREVFIDDPELSQEFPGEEEEEEI
jgi:hypothetical protein